MKIKASYGLLVAVLLTIVLIYFINTKRENMCDTSLGSDPLGQPRDWKYNRSMNSPIITGMY